MSRNRSFLTVLLRSLTGILLVASAGCAQVQPQAQPPEVNLESNPYCLVLAPDLLRAANEWKQPSIDGKVLDRPEGDADVPAGVKIRVKLFPSEKVALIRLPRIAEVRVPFYSGLASFQTGKAGLYRVMLSQYLWIEMIEPSGDLAVVGWRAGVMDSNKSLNRCTGMGKNLSFALKADTRYWLQLTGARQGAVGEFVISAPD